MATAAELGAVQLAILRTQNVVEAAAEASAGTDVLDYMGMLIERAERTTEAALLMTECVVGMVPTSAHLTTLAVFAQQQFDHYLSVLKVADPELGVYEAFGRSLSSTMGFHAQSDGKSDNQFIFDTWIKANNATTGDAPADAVVQHYQEQITFFTNLYTQAGIAPAEAANQARGAVFGQIVGAAADVEDGHLDQAAEVFLKGTVTGTAIYSATLNLYPCDLPPPPEGFSTSLIGVAEGVPAEYGGA